MQIRKSIAVLLAGCLHAQCLFAEHPIDIQRKAANGEYFQALVAYERLPKRRLTSDSLVAAAKSEWALGLVSQAISNFDLALQDESLSTEKRARVLLSRGIIEYQEGRFQMASLYADKAVKLLKEPSALRSRVWQLWGESLAKMNSSGVAEEKLNLALAEAESSDMPSINFALGEVQLKLNKLDQARFNFEQVPLNHEKTPQAIRNLAQIALNAGNYQSAEFWLKKGRADFADDFLDSWVDYALMQSAIYKGESKEVRRIRAEAQKSFAPSDPWLVLLDAAAEAYEWSETGRN